ncbi:hypothetical protein R1sor_003912 [Riccia sorocarpa]|uniref:MULE transposase domain-containing protein n=1 Tax=Riccia sorocarpa TaxID=122646 RepID=A0ABD3H305_9MARC
METMYSDVAFMLIFCAKTNFSLHFGTRESFRYSCRRKRNATEGLSDYERWVQQMQDARGTEMDMQGRTMESIINDASRIKLGEDFTDGDDSEFALELLVLMQNRATHRGKHRSECRLWLLHTSLGDIDITRTVIISDKQKGILPALVEMFPGIVNGCCGHHIQVNVRSKFGKRAESTYKNILYATTEERFALPLPLGKVISNVVESANAAILRIRENAPFKIMFD